MSTNNSSTARWFAASVKSTAQELFKLICAIVVICSPAFSQTFTMADTAVISQITDGSGPLTVGYAYLHPNPSNWTPATFTIFSQRIGGILVSETSVQGSFLGAGRRIYVEVNGPVTTGIAIVSLLGTANINFHLTDLNGNNVSSGTITVPARQQVSRFLTEPPFNATSPFEGTLTLTGNIPGVSAAALHGYLNERNEFIWTTLPLTLVNLPVAPSTATSYLPHFADGEGWATEIVLVNPTDSTISGNVQFFSQAGEAITVTANGQTASRFPYLIPPQSSFKFSTSGVEPSGTVLSGSVRVIPDTGATPSAQSIFSFRNGDGIVVSEAGTWPALPGGFKTYVEETMTAGAFPAIQTGFAVANLMSIPMTVTLSLTGVDGSPVATTSLSIPSNGQIAKMLHDVFPEIPYPIQGVLDIRPSPAVGSLSAVAFRFRYNERGEILTTTLPIIDDLFVSSDRLMPQFLNGAGWTTQLIMVGHSMGQSSTFQLSFTQQNGSLFDVPWD